MVVVETGNVEFVYAVVTLLTLSLLLSRVLDFVLPLQCWQGRLRFNQLHMVEPFAARKGILKELSLPSKILPGLIVGPALTTFCGFAAFKGKDRCPPFSRHQA